MKIQNDYNNKIIAAKLSAFLRIISIAGLLGLITVTQVVAGFPKPPKPPSPKTVVDTAVKNVDEVKKSGEHYLNSSANINHMTDNMNRTKNLYHNDDGSSWIDSMENVSTTQLNKIPEAAHLINVNASTPYLKDAVTVIKSFAGTVQALKDAQDKSMRDRVKLMELQFNNGLYKFLDIFNDLKSPIDKIKKELETKYYIHATVEISNTSYEPLVKHLSKVSGKSEADILKPVSLGAPRTVAVATYMRADGENRRDVTGKVNKRIKEQGNGLFLNIEAWPNSGSAETLFGDVAKGYDKIFWVRDLNGEEYFWPDKKEVYFIPPLKIGAGYWVDHSGSQIGSGWGGFKFVTSGDDTNVFAVQSDGALKHYVNASSGPEGKWSAGKIGSGWAGFTNVFAGPANTIYAINPNGDLKWYKSLGGGKWAKGSGNKVGGGWGMFKYVFHGGGGVIYGVKPSGTLHWYKRADNSSQNWESGAGAQIGSGWTKYNKIFGAYPNYIFGIEPNGKLHEYKRSNSGKSGAWVKGSGKVVGSGWDEHNKVFANNKGVIYGITGGGSMLWYKHN